MCLSRSASSRRRCSRSPLLRTQRAAIVDTNNPAELPDGVTKANIHSIVDHHKMSGFTNGAPLEVDIRTLCSTGSILYARAKAAARKIPKHIAALMLSCILSDSLEFRSPTTTPDDIKFAKELAEIAGIDLHAHAEAMLDAKAEIGHLAPKDVVMMDSKVYEIGGKKLRISVVETTKPARALEQRQKLVDAQNAIKKDEKLDDVLLFIVDILNESATFLASTSTAADLVEKAWGCTFNAADSTCVLPGVLEEEADNPHPRGQRLEGRGGRSHRHPHGRGHPGGGGVSQR